MPRRAEKFDFEIGLPENKRKAKLSNCEWKLKEWHLKFGPFSWDQSQNLDCQSAAPIRVICKFFVLFSMKHIKLENFEKRANLIETEL